jgi:glutamate racemase
VTVYDSTDVVAKEVKNKLQKHRLLNDKQRNPHRFYVSDYTPSFEKTTKIFFENDVKLEEAAIWTKGM